MCERGGRREEEDADSLEGTFCMEEAELELLRDIEVEGRVG